MIDYFKKYVDREEAILNYWIEKNPWIKSVFIKYEDDHTPFHDWRVFLKDEDKMRVFTVQVKEEEVYWYKKTGNIGLDFISSFNFSKLEFKKEIIKNKFWINPEEINTFLNKKIIVSKWGKLITCDATIHIFFVKEEFCQAYSNSKLKSKYMLKYLKSKYNLRINKKEDYDLKDTWESAAFFVKPEDAELKKCEINNLDELKKEIEIYTK